MQRSDHDTKDAIESPDMQGGKKFSRLQKKGLNHKNISDFIQEKIDKANKIREELEKETEDKEPEFDEPESFEELEQEQEDEDAKEDMNLCDLLLKQLSSGLYISFHSILSSFEEEEDFITSQVRNS